MNAASSSLPSSLAASWAGWAVTSLTSKFYKSSKTGPTGTTAPSPHATSTQPTSDTTSPTMVEAPRVASIEHTSEDASVDSASDYEEKWDDQDWGKMGEESSARGGAGGGNPEKRSTSPQPALSPAEDGWDDGGWESFEEEPAPLQQSVKPADGETKPASSYNWGTWQEDEAPDFFSGAVRSHSSSEAPVRT